MACPAACAAVTTLVGRAVGWVRDTCACPQCGKKRSDDEAILWNSPDPEKYLSLDENIPLEDVRDFLAAFEACDKGKKSTAEFSRLMVMLEVPGGADRVKIVLSQTKRKTSALITQQEFMTAVKELKVPTTRIRRLKQVFDAFDHDQSGWASKSDVINGLENLGVDVDGELKDNLEKMDATNDGKIWFPDFLRVQLNM